MASSITVQCLNGRRQVVKVTRNTTILHILEEVCKKQGYPVDDFDLKHHKKVLNLSDTFFFSGIPNNGLIEIVKREQSRAADSPVIVALQLENGERKTESYPSDSTLWHIVTHCNGSEFLDDMEPVCIYMRTEVVGENNLKSTTLRSLGLTGGKAAIRFLRRPAGALKEQAFKEALTFPKKSVEEVKTPAKTVEQSPPVQAPMVLVTNKEVAKTEKKDVIARKTPEPMEHEDNSKVTSWDRLGTGRSLTENSPQVLETEEAKPAELSESMSSVSSLNCKIYVLDVAGSFIFNMDDLPVPVDHLPDSFYEHTLDDVKYLMNDLKRKRQDMENALLQTSTMRNSESQRQLDKYKQCILRVMFPDRLVIQSVFQPGQTIANVMDFLKQYVDVTDFYLYITPPKTILGKDVTLQQASLVPNALVHIGSGEQKEHFIKQSILDKLELSEMFIKPTRPHRRDSTGASPAKAEQPVGERVMDQSEVPRNVPSETDSLPSTSAASPTEKVPKWFKFGKK